jgi:large subunit ribosomal protein L13
VTNASKIKVTGDKESMKYYFRHSGYAGGAKTISYRLQMERDPRKVVYLAVKRMLDDNTLRGKQMKRLKIYPGEAHPHASNGIEVSHG